jgi:hypothetical protein
MWRFRCAQVRSYPEARDMGLSQRELSEEQGAFAALQASRKLLFLARAE